MKKLLAGILCMSLFLVETTTCEASQAVTAPSQPVVEVTAEINSDYTVIVPKRIVLNSTTRTADYTVTVEGDLPGNGTLRVVPDSSFTFTQTGKAGVQASVLQDKTEWTASNISTGATGIISAKDLTSGTWAGNFKFTIELSY